MQRSFPVQKCLRCRCSLVDDGLRTSFANQISEIQQFVRDLPPGVKVLIDSDAHGTNTLSNIRYGVATARRAWLTADQVANTRPWPEFAALRKRAS